MAQTSRSIDVNYNGPQFRAYSALADRRSLFLGFGRGVGKSHWVRSVIYTKVAEWDHRLRENCPKRLRGVRFVFFMPTLIQFKDVHWSDFENDLLPGGEWDFLGAKLDRQRGQIKFPGGSWIKPFPSTAYNSRAGRGVRCDGIITDECDDTDAEAYDSVAIPWLSEPWSFGWEFLTGTPTRGRHGLWYRSLQASKLARKIRRGELSEEQALETDVAKSVREVFENLEAKDWPEHLPHSVDAATLSILKSQYGFHATYRDAPETVSPLAVAQAKAKMTPATFKREWEADPDAGEGLVYPFDENFHVRSADNWSEYDEFIVGMDHGWTDPGCLLLGGVRGHGEDATVHVLAEVYKTETPPHEWDELVAEWDVVHGRKSRLWADRSQPARVNDLRAKHIDANPSDSAPGAIKDGIARVADMLFIRSSERMGPAFEPILERRSRLYIDPSCTNTVREFGMYRNKKDSEGNFHDQPEDKNNHAMDALRYMIVGRFGRLPNYRHESGR